MPACHGRGDSSVTKHRIATSARACIGPRVANGHSYIIMTAREPPRDLRHFILDLGTLWTVTLKYTFTVYTRAEQGHRVQR